MSIVFYIVFNCVKRPSVLVDQWPLKSRFKSDKSLHLQRKKGKVYKLACAASIHRPSGQHLGYAAILLSHSEARWLRCFAQRSEGCEFESLLEPKLGDLEIVKV